MKETEQEYYRRIGLTAEQVGDCVLVPRAICHLAAYHLDNSTSGSYIEKPNVAAVLHILGGLENDRG